MDTFTAINQALDSGEPVDEFGFVLDDLPDGYIKDGTKLGLTYATAMRLGSYGLDAFLELKKAQDTGASSSSSSTSPDSGPHDDMALATRAVLLVNANSYTAWHARKELVQAGALSLADEVSFTTLIFTKHPKSAEGWAHRRWLLAQAPSPAELIAQCEADLVLCKRIAEIYPKNYYSWSHRQWVATTLRDKTVEGKIAHADLEAFLEKDLAHTRQWTKVNVSDYCGFHHVQVLLTAFAFFAPKDSHEHTLAAHLAAAGRGETPAQGARNGAEEGPLRRKWEEELARVSDLIRRYPSHETLWSHARYVALGVSILGGSIGEFTTLAKDTIATVPKDMKHAMHALLWLAMKGHSTLAKPEIESLRWEGDGLDSSFALAFSP